MQTALHRFLLDVPEAAAIWLVLLAVAVVTVSVLSPPTRRGKPRPNRSVPAGGEAPADRPADEHRRYANEVAVAADRAAATAQRQYTQWEKAHDAVGSAWAAFDAADRAARRAVAAAAFPPPASPRTPAEYASRERYLHQAARAASRRGDMTSGHLADVLAHRNGWDPRLHPVEQELVLRRFAREHALATYLDATGTERRMWRTAELAEAAMRSLRAEALAAAARAAAAGQSTATTWLDEQLRRGAPNPAPVPVARLAIR